MLSSVSTALLFLAGGSICPQNGAARDFRVVDCMGSKAEVKEDEDHQKKRAGKYGHVPARR